MESVGNEEQNLFEPLLFHPPPPPTTSKKESMRSKIAKTFAQKSDLKDSFIDFQRNFTTENTRRTLYQKRTIFKWQKFSFLKNAMHSLTSLFWCGQVDIPTRSCSLEPASLKGMVGVYSGGRGLGSDRPRVFPRPFLLCDWLEGLWVSECLETRLLVPSSLAQSLDQRGSVCGGKVEIKSCFRSDLCPPFLLEHHSLPLSGPPPQQLATYMLLF